jgi:hypothetical protein
MSLKLLTFFILISYPILNHPVFAFYIQHLMRGRLRGKTTGKKKALENTRA